MKRLLCGLSAVALLTITACSSASAPPTPSVSVSVEAATPGAGDSGGFLTRHGLDGKDPQEIVEALEVTNDDRKSGPFGSVRPDHLVLADDTEEVTLPIEGQFYLSLAPYLTKTHECYNHNLASCQGELPGEKFSVTIVDADGTELVNQEVTTHANGFVGFWLPRDITATVTVSGGDRSATQEIKTGADDPTCITTMQLT